MVKPMEAKSLLDLFQHQSDSVDIQRKKWGMLSVVICKAHNRNKQITGAFLSYGRFSQKNHFTSLLINRNKPTYVVKPSLKETPICQLQASSGHLLKVKIILTRNLYMAIRSQAVPLCRTLVRYLPKLCWCNSGKTRRQYNRI